jgi:hypothetical protein
MGGGAAGLVRADPRMGTPPKPIVVGRAVLNDPTYQPVNEDRYDRTWPAAREDIIRSDLTFFETPNGGAVSSVGSMNFVGAPPIDNLRQRCGAIDHQYRQTLCKLNAVSRPANQPTSETSPQRKTISLFGALA